MAHTTSTHDSALPVTFEEIRFRVRDGLQLYARRYPATPSPRAKPVLCLPGLTRNSKDFDALARYLANDTSGPRDVYTLDFRGRGQSDWDDNWKNYSVLLEALDVVDFCTLMGLHKVNIVGTSRGGLVTMVLAAMQPGLIGTTVLNDIGPVLEADGFMRIASYVGKTMLPTDWNDAAAKSKAGNAAQFPDLSDADWQRFARQLFNEKNGKPTAGYDPKLGNAFSVLDGGMPPIWPQYKGLTNAPMLILRGELSDLLAAETTEEMCRRHAAAEAYTVPREGHAPLLWDEATQRRISQFLQHTSY
ncbi:MAG: alpha/beta hydrolase [Pseudomonadota bacterium]